MARGDEFREGQRVRVRHSLGDGRTEVWEGRVCGGIAGGADAVAVVRDRDSTVWRCKTEHVTAIGTTIGTTIGSNTGEAFVTDLASDVAGARVTLAIGEEGGPTPDHIERARSVLAEAHDRVHRSPLARFAGSLNAEAIAIFNAAFALPEHRTMEQQLALAVLMGDDAAANALVDRLIEAREAGR